MGKEKQRKLNIRQRQSEILLSISIMVSGREETAEKCIASLSRLRGRVPCELILTDTGCSEELRQRLKKRADKYIPFTWCNDFAAARNVGVRAAAGKWFMFMDDDEWFENTLQIEQFFLSGEYRRYESASYIVRNYANMEGTVWRDTPIVRMARMRSNTQFFYPIHEVLWPVPEPVKRMEDYVHHYGYASQDPEVQRKKRERNLSLLLPAIEQDPGCMHHYLQAVSEYVSQDDYASALRTAEQGIANYDPERGENGNHLLGLYAAVVKFLVRQKQYERAIETGKQFLETVELSKLCETAVCCDLAIAEENLDNAEECCRYLEIYLRNKDYFKNHHQEWMAQQTIVLDACMEDFQYRKVMGHGFAALLNLKKEPEAEVLLQREAVDWWMETVQRWYTLADEERRERWKLNFDNMANAVGGGKNSRIRELYNALTEKVQPEEAQREGLLTPAKEMEQLAVKLKEQIRFLTAQGQVQAAVQIISQLRNFFPEDKELTVWQEELEQKGNMEKREGNGYEDGNSGRWPGNKNQ